MPTLPLEPMLWPMDALEPAMASARIGQWWVLHVKPRAEKALARKCYHRQVSFFLPQSRRLQRRLRRAQEAYIPLFPGYVFLFGRENDRLKALETNLVVNVLNVHDQRQLVDDLTRIHRAVESGLSISRAEQWQPGMAAEIEHGPLSGMQGTVVRRKNKMALILEVAFLQQRVSVELEDWMVDPILPTRMN